jgi:hypothetical protein
LEGGDWITWSSLMTFGGAVAAVTVVSQFLKGPLDQMWRIPTRLMVLGISWAVLLARDFVLTGGQMGFEQAVLALLNGFLVALAAMGAHAFAKSNMNWK